MKKMTSQEIRETWLNFFKERGHMIAPSASLIPHNDPSLLWINAGVAALKKYFDGSEIPPSKRITNVQKCIRTNDIENVGKTARHHTFFEMLGNFSIGDYFRKEVIGWATEILTSDKYFGLDIDKLYVTYHPSDLETKSLWLEHGFKEDHIIPLEGNFWQIGEGPCGPNTEVFYDRGEKRDENKVGDALLRNDIENDRYIEIWGIVFSQFNAENGVARENYKELPHKNIDTGAGLERITCVLQGTDTNFETDLFFPIIEEIQKLCGKPYEGEYLMPYRVIADHIRACTFALADGESFSNEGRGYVLRRLLRRAMRFGQKLGFHEPFFYKLVDKTIDIMKDFYPYLEEKADLIKKMIKLEEEKFLKTLVSGENILYVLMENKEILSGEDAFKLYDTYGFPIDLTREICEDKGVKVDLEGFNVFLEKQREQARKARKNIDSFNKQSKDLLEFNEKSEFIYTMDDIQSKITGLFKEGVKVECIDDEGEVALEKTNFYAEMGGQVSDTGKIIGDNFEAEVLNVMTAPNKQHLLYVKVKYGEIHLGDNCSQLLNKKRRFAIMKNHTATHLLQSALISVLGNGIKQKGSFVNDEYLRFDFSHFEKISDEDLHKVENLVNEYIAEGIENKTLILPIEEAKKTGAIAEFDQKYGDIIRVVTFGDISKEFCGGTHVQNTADCGIFFIKSEESISAGVRRIEATTSLNAYKMYCDKVKLLSDVKDSLKVKSDSEILAKMKSISTEMNNLSLELNALKKEKSANIGESLIKEIKTDGSLTFISKYLKGNEKSTLLEVLDLIKSKTSNYLVVLVGDENGKHPLIVGVSKNLNAENKKAGDVIKTITSKFGGNGGGRPDMAQGNVQDISGINNLSLQELLK